MEHFPHSLLWRRYCLASACHHMLRGFQDANNPAFWTKASEGKIADEELMAFVKESGLSACVDLPMALLWKDLARLYPNAKVLLNIRDPVKWFHSVNNTILQIQNFITKSWMALPLRMIMKLKRSNQNAAAEFACFAPTCLGPLYPRGIFGAVLSGAKLCKIIVFSTRLYFR